MPQTREALREKYRTDPAYREKIAAYKRARRARDPQKVKEQEKASYLRKKAANPEKLRADSLKRVVACNRRLAVTDPDRLARKQREFLAKKSTEWREQRSANRRSQLEAKKKEAAGRPRPDTCDVCGGSRIRIVFDHCHTSGLFRGWICSPCNTVLGLIDDDPELLRRLAKYLEDPLAFAPVTPIS